MSNPTGKGGFRERPHDIYKKGRPKVFDAWREMLLEIMAEPAVLTQRSADGREGQPGLFLIKIPKVVGGKPVLDEHGNPVMIDHYATNAEIIARSWLKDPKRQVSLAEYAFGRAPQAVETPPSDNKDANATGAEFRIPADMLAPSFVKSYRAVRSGRYTEFCEYGGRGSTKSSFISLAIIELIKNNPTMHALVMRQVANTLRDSVFAQIKWAISELGLMEQFRATTNPMEITYLPTGQKIYFRGGDDPGNIKSIKTTFGYIGILWFEELDQFRGAEAVRKIEQSIRGGEKIYKFKSWNPPRTSASWVNRYIQIPKASMWTHASNYLDVPDEWLGQPWLDEANHLRQVNPAAYEHEYLGIVNGTGGQVFGNVELRKITDAEIAEFDRVLRGLDWGFFPDPFSFGLMHYDAARMTLYIFGEFRGYKMSNRQIWDALVESGLVAHDDLIIADSAEPKSIADFREYGANIRGAEKGPDSVDYSMKWLASRAKIIIDPERAPYHAREFLEYELEQDKNGEFISAYPDHDNHAIDDVRYATNLIWRKRGQ